MRGPCTVVGCHMTSGCAWFVTTAQLVAQGFGQQEGINYSETFTPVIMGIRDNPGKGDSITH